MITAEIQKMSVPCGDNTRIITLRGWLGKEEYDELRENRREDD
jgi:hypothetical protein